MLRSRWLIYYNTPLSLIYVSEISKLGPKKEERGKTTWGKSSLKYGHEKETKNNALQTK